MLGSHTSICSTYEPIHWEIHKYGFTHTCTFYLYCSLAFTWVLTHVLVKVHTAWLQCLHIYCSCRAHWGSHLFAFFVVNCGVSENYLQCWESKRVELRSVSNHARWIQWHRRLTGLLHMQDNCYKPLSLSSSLPKFLWAEKLVKSTKQESLLRLKA